MKRIICFTCLLVCAAVVTPAGAATAKSKSPNKGLEAARAITQITGVAISPLLGAGAIGAWEWAQARTPEEKARLPWYGQMSFWLPALLLVGAVAFKDAAGTAVPPGLKKPLDVAETIENKVSGLVAAGAVVPMLAMLFPMFTETGTQAAGTPAVCLAGIAAFNFSSILNLLTVPLAVTVFVLVWLASHAINVLILLSPWGVVDAALKSMRTALLGAVTLVHFINPWIGAALSIIIIIIAYFLAGWSFRLMICGSLYVWDFLTRRKRRFKPSADANWMFAGRRIEKVPVRTYGTLRRSTDGALNFHYRPWLVGKPREVRLPNGTYVVGRGLFYSEILSVEGEDERTLFLLPPRYRTHEDEVRQIYQLTEVRAIGLRRFGRWIKSLFGFGASPTISTA